jgi:hypothetical protein
MAIALQDVFIRMVSGSFRFSFGLHFKSLWRLNVPLFGFYSSWRLPSEHRPRPDPQLLQQELLQPRFQIAESEFWWLPGVGYRKRYCLYTLPDKQREEWFDTVNWRGIKKVWDKGIYQVVSSKPIHEYRCPSTEGDEFYCNPVNVDARIPDLSFTHELYHLRPLLAAVQIELVGEGTYLGRPVALLRGVPKPLAELENPPFLTGWSGPEDWWLIADYYDLILDIREGLLLHYWGHVKEGILVESKILELDTSNEGARSERVFQV